MARVDRGSSARWSNGSFAWRARTGTGAITGLRALANLGYIISDQTVGNVLQRHALPPAPEHKRTTTWPVFIRTHLALLAGTDFFTAEVLTLRGLVTYYVLFFIHLESRRVDIAGITVHPDEPWMKQIARNATMEGCGVLRDCRYLLHDRDTKFTRSFRAIVASGRIKPLALPARHVERNHQGKGNILLFPRDTDRRCEGPVRCRERLGGLLRYYYQEAAWSSTPTAREPFR